MAELRDCSACRAYYSGSRLTAPLTHPVPEQTAYDTTNDRGCYVAIPLWCLCRVTFLT